MQYIFNQPFKEYSLYMGYRNCDDQEGLGERDRR